MPSLSTKIAQSIIISGLFIVVAFVAIYYQNPVSGFYFVIAFVVFFIIAFGLAMGRTFARPVQQMLEQADSVKNGHANKIFYLKTKDEVEELAKTFDKIAHDFEQTKSKAESLKTAAEIKFKTKDLLSDQVAKALEQKIKNRTNDLERALAELDNMQVRVKMKDEQITALEAKIAKLSKKKKRTIEK